MPSIRDARLSALPAPAYARGAGSRSTRRRAGAEGAPLNDNAPTLMPPDVVRLFDGERLADKVGLTALLVAGDQQGRPRVALLSAAEVLATSRSQLAMLTYSGSRTTGAVLASGHAMLLTVLGGVVHKIMLDVGGATTTEAVPDGYTVLRGTVSACEQDTSGYATVRHGIEFDLADTEAVLDRWHRQIRLLRTVEDR